MAGLINKIRGLGADNKKKKKKNFDSNSIYSVVSCSDLTPGSLEIWVDLPNEIKFDPSLAPFKQLYEQHHGKLESECPSEGDRDIFARKATELETIGEVDSGDLRTRDSPPAPGDRLINEPVNDETRPDSTIKKKRISRLLRPLKLGFLSGCWLLLTVALVMNRETGDVVLHTAVQAGAIKEYVLDAAGGNIRVLIKLTGPFQQNGNLDANGSEHGVLRVWLQRAFDDPLHGESSTYWKVPLQPDSVIDFSRSEIVSKILKLPNDGKFVIAKASGVLNDKIETAAGNSTKQPHQSDMKGAMGDDRDDDTHLDAKTHRHTRNVAEDITTGDVPKNFTSEYRDAGVSHGSKEADNSFSDNLPQIKARNNLDGIDSRTNSTDTIRAKRKNVFRGNGAKGDLDLSVTLKNTTNEDWLINSSIQNVKKESLKLRMDTTSNATVPITLTYKVNPLEEDGVVYATILLFFLYVLIIFEVVNRTVAALLASSLGIAVLALGGSRPSLAELVSWLDMETLLLLFSMMLLVAILAETGLFDYLAVVAFEVTGGRTWPLINCLCLFTAVSSTFLDNVTTVLLMTPVTIRLCEVMQLNPVPVLMSMVVFSNVGGAATPVGDPPNVIIASHPAVVAEGINFTTFTLHMGLGILLVAVQTYLQLRFMFRDMRKLRHNIPHDIQELRQEIAVWRRAAASLSSYSRDEDLVRKTLEKKVERLQKTLMRREVGGGSKTDPKFCSTLAQMKQKYRIRDKPLLIKSTICVTFVVVVFFLHCIPELQRLSLGWTALLGALLLLLLADHDDLEPILARVEWSTLLFFAALFVLMEALSKLGLITWIGYITETIIRMVSEESRLAVALMLVLWVSGIASAFVDNIPLTTMMVRVVAALGAPDGLGLPLAPLAWALSFGACLGGNGTLIGASANVVCAGVAEQHGYRFTFMQFFRVGFPIMIGHLMVTSVYLLLCHCAFSWH